MRSNSDNLSIGDNGGFHVASLWLLSLLKLLAPMDQVSTIADSDGDLVTDLDRDLENENLKGEKLGVWPRVDRRLLLSSSDRPPIPSPPGGLSDRARDLAC